MWDNEGTEDKGSLTKKRTNYLTVVARVCFHVIHMSVPTAEWQRIEVFNERHWDHVEHRDKSVFPDHSRRRAVERQRRAELEAALFAMVCNGSRPLARCRTKRRVQGTSLMLRQRANGGMTRLIGFHATRREVWNSQRLVECMEVRHVNGHASCADVESGRSRAKDAQMMNAEEDAWAQVGADQGALREMGEHRSRKEWVSEPPTRRKDTWITEEMDHPDSMAPEVRISKREYFAISGDPKQELVQDLGQIPDRNMVGSRP